MKNHLKEVYAESDQILEGDNRSAAIRSINQVLDQGQIKIVLVEEGYFRNYNKSDGTKFGWNIKITGFGRCRRAYMGGGYYEPLNVAQQLAKFLQTTEVQEKIGLTYKRTQKCSRCGGKGWIEAFNYYCNGVCFGCMGSGIDTQLVTEHI